MAQEKQDCQGGMEFKRERHKLGDQYSQAKGRNGTIWGGRSKISANAAISGTTITLHRRHFEGKEEG